MLQSIGAFLYNREVLRAFLLYKTPPGDRTAAYNENVAGATAAGEEFRKRNSLFYNKKVLRAFQVLEVNHETHFKVYLAV